MKKLIRLLISLGMMLTFFLMNWLFVYQQEPIPIMFWIYLGFLTGVLILHALFTKDVT